MVYHGSRCVEGALDFERISATVSCENAIQSSAPAMGQHRHLSSLMNCRKFSSFVYLRFVMKDLQLESSELDISHIQSEPVAIG